MKVVTICARNYLPYARVLARSFASANPDDSFVALLVDLLPTDELPAENFEVIGPASLDLDEDDFARMTFIYDVTELATALKPWALRWVLDSGHDVAVYLDPDIAVYESLASVAEAATRQGIALTPHRLTPIPRDGLRPNEADIMCSGIQNLGFIAVTDAARPWLSFWQERLLMDSVVDLPNQLFTDQRWTDWIPALYDYERLADPGLNVAYWNLDERGLEREGNSYTCLGHPLRFYHFSGYRPSRPWCLSKYISDAPRVVISEYPDLMPLLADYDAQLRAEGLYDPDTEPYRYGTFENGAAITKGIRRLYRHELLEARNPRMTGDSVAPPVPDHRNGFANLRDWLCQPSTRMPGLTKLAYSIWASRVDLQATFPDPQGASRQAYGEWLVDFGVTEGYVDEDWIAALEPIEINPLPLSDEPGCNVFGYFSSVLGVGTSGRTLVDATRRSGLPLNVFTSNRTLSARTVEFEATATAQRYPVNIVVMNADAFPFWVEEWGASFAPDAHTIGYWFWELENFPPHMHRALAHVDEIWTGSHFNAEAYRAATDKPVHIFPVPVAQPAERPWPALDFVTEETGYFLFACDYLSEVERKNPHGLIAAYTKAFPAMDGPALVIKSINGEQRRTEREMVRMAAAAHPHVHLLEDYLPVEELQSLTQHALAFVSLHRSEGLGLGLMEAMAAGTPVIATRYSGNLEFMDDDNSLLIPHELVPITESGGYYNGLGVWANPDLDCAAAAMRELAFDRDFARNLGLRAQRDILTRFTEQRAADFIRARVAEATAPEPEPEPEPELIRSPAYVQVRQAYRRVLNLPLIGQAAHASVRVARGAKRRVTPRLDSRD